MSTEVAIELTAARKATLKSLGRFYYCQLKCAIDVYCEWKQAVFFAREIRTQFSTPAEREYLKTLLTDRQWDDLKRLIEIVKTEKIVTAFIGPEAVDTKFTSKRELSTYEKQVRTLIIKYTLPLQTVLNLSKLDDITYEYNLEKFGRSDMWIRSNNVGYPIEIKDETADVKVVPQIVKYVRGAMSTLHHGWYDWVTGVVIAPAFTEQTVKELQRAECIALQIELTKDSYTLERV